MYNKLFSKILDSSIWLEPDPTRIVWVTLLAAMDEDGFCAFACAANVANRARVPLEAAEEALRILESPDPNSADPDDAGRRIERVPGGWIVLNAVKYAQLATREKVKESTRRRVQAFRERQRNAPVTPCNVPVTPSDTDTDTDTNTNTIEERESNPLVESEKAFDQGSLNQGIQSQPPRISSSARQREKIATWKLHSLSNSLTTWNSCTGVQPSTS